MVFKLPKLFIPYTEWLEKQQSSILSAAAIITTATFVSSFFGLLRLRLISAVFLKSRAEFGAYAVATTIPDTVFQLLILGALSAAFIPLFSQYQKESDQEAFRMTSTMMNVLLLLFLFFSVIVFIFAEPLTRLTTGQGFSSEQVTIAANLTRIMLGAQFFFAISNFFTGILQSYRRFVIPAIAPILYNVGIVTGVYLFSGKFGIYSTGIGVVLGAFLHMAIQLPLVYKLGFRYRFRLDIHHPGLKTLLRLTPPRVTTIGVTQFQNLADNFFSTSITTGEFFQLNVWVLNIAQTLMALPIRFFGTPIAQAALPFFVAEAEKQDLSHLRDLVIKSIHQISFFALPASVMLLILRIPVVRISFGVRDLPWVTTVLTGRTFGIIAISITAQAIVQLLIRAFYALKNTRTPFYITCIDTTFYIFLNWLFIFVLHTDVMGIGVATTLAAFLELSLFLLFLNRRLPGLLCKALWLPQLKMITASFFMAVSLYLPFRILDRLVFQTSHVVELFLLTVIASTIGMLVYIAFAALLNIRELYMVRNIMNKIPGWKKTLAQTEEVLLETGVDGNEV